MAGRKRKCKPPSALSGFVVQSGLETGRGAPQPPPRKSARSRVAQEASYVPSMTPTIKVAAKGRGRKPANKPASSPKRPSAKKLKRDTKTAAAKYNTSREDFAKALDFYYQHNQPGKGREIVRQQAALYNLNPETLRTHFKRKHKPEDLLLKSTARLLLGWGCRAHHRGHHSAI